MDISTPLEIFQEALHMNLPHQQIKQQSQVFIVHAAVNAERQRHRFNKA